MSTLVAIGYPDETTAEQAQKTVQELQSELIIQASQVAAISRDQKGDYHVHTPRRRSLVAAARGSQRAGAVLRRAGL